MIHILQMVKMKLREFRSLLISGQPGGVQSHQMTKTKDIKSSPWKMRTVSSPPCVSESGWLSETFLGSFSIIIVIVMVMVIMKTPYSYPQRFCFSKSGWGLGICSFPKITGWLWWSFRIEKHWPRVCLLPVAPELNHARPQVGDVQPAHGPHLPSGKWGTAGWHTNPPSLLPSPYTLGNVFSLAQRASNLVGITWRTLWKTATTNLMSKESKQSKGKGGAQGLNIYILKVPWWV